MVSVIIPCYNAESFIDRSIQSVLNQDYHKIELIVVDDGSTDNSKAKILAWKVKFEKKGFDLKYIFQDNKGPAIATSNGLRHVHGKYLSLLDADDFFLKDSIAKRVDFLEEHPDYAGVRTNGWMLDGTKKTQFIKSEKEKNETDYFHALFFDDAVNWSGSYMVRTKLLFDFYPTREIYESRFGQNLQIILPVAYKNKFGIIDEPLMVYFRTDNSLSQTLSQGNSDMKFFGFIDIYKHMVDSIIKDEEEKAIYEDRINYWIYRHRCDSLIASNNSDELHDNVKALIKTGNATLNDKIKYYSHTHKIRAGLYRAIRRLRKVT